MGPEQAARSWTAGAAYARVSGDLRGQSGGAAHHHGRPAAALPAGRHAAHDDRLRAPGSHSHLSETRRIHTDGRAWPAKITPSIWGYSIGRWIDQDGDGRYDLLEVETRHFNGPRYLDADGLPLHKNNRTIVKERIFLDQANNDLMHAEITTIDDAFTRPWTVMRDYNRERNPVWPEYLCAEANNHIIIGKERYFRSADGHLMPLRKVQPPPDLRNFGKPR
jgi:hypothetical protein